MAKLTEEEKARRAATRRRNEALRAEERAIRDEKKRLEWEENGTSLSLEELRAGVPCRSCGMPVIDGLGSWPPLLKMDDQQRQEYEAADADYRKRHAGCESHRWSMQGSRTTHCGFCCPSPPMSEGQLEKIAALFSRIGPTDPIDLDTWRLTLTCGHVLEKTQHRSHASWTRSVDKCPDCQQTRGIVESEKLSPTLTRRNADHRRASGDLEQARKEHARLQKKAGAALRRITKLEEEISALVTRE